MSHSQRFWSRVDKRGADECWPWLGRVELSGHGVIDIGGRPVYAHRFAFFDLNPGADRSATICHSCDNPPCCNPSHLWAGTQLENIEDMRRKGRAKAPPIRRGEASNKAKLTATEAISIFNSSESGPVLAARYGVSKEAINLIKRGKNWAHVTGGAS